jgi:hypothetical protein
MEAQESNGPEGGSHQNRDTDSTAVPHPEVEGAARCRQAATLDSRRVRERVSEVGDDTRSTDGRTTNGKRGAGVERRYGCGVRERL